MKRRAFIRTGGLIGAAGAVGALGVGITRSRGGRETASGTASVPGTPAVPDTAAYGPMSVAVALLAEARILRRVPPQVFWPPPKVESAVLQLTPRDPARARELRAAGLQDLLRKGFAHRRKTLRKAFGAELLERAGLDPGARPAAVEPEGWVRLLHAGA